MKKLILMVFVVSLCLVTSPVASAGDCKTRDAVDWHATISSSVFVRSDCPTGDVVGTVPAGEVVEILEVDRYKEFYLIRTSVGTGFVFSSFLKDINQSPLPGKVEEAPAKEYLDSIFIDLDPNPVYYDQIADVKARGIVGGHPDGTIKADEGIKRVELAKILVEATTDDDTIATANLGSGIYSDIKLGEWYVPYLKVARDKKIMMGDSGKSTVRPADFANGAEVAKMIAIAFELDVREADAGEFWYLPYMEKLEDMGALPFKDGEHRVTRGEMMFMISKVLESTS